MTSGDVPAILDHLAEDVRWEEWDDNSAQREGVPWLLARRGKAGVLEFFGVMGAMQMRDFRVHSLMAGGNQVAAEVVRLRHYVGTAKHMAAAQA